MGSVELVESPRDEVVVPQGGGQADSQAGLGRLDYSAVYQVVKPQE